MSDQDKSWAPHICCVTCVRLLTGWVNSSRHMPFAVPMVWRELKDHSSDCYFCLMNITGITSKSKHSVKYLYLPSAMRPVPHSEDLRVPQPPENVTLSDDDLDPHQEQEDTNLHDTNFEPTTSSFEPHLLTQGDLNNLIRDNLSKKRSQLLGSSLKGWNLLDQDTKICYFCNRHDESFRGCKML